jgi:polysaccharide export outer membrane protein
MMTHQLSLLDALTMAGGLMMDRASDYALLQRGGAGGEANTPDPEGDAEVVRIDLKPLLEGGDLSLNIQLAGGDVLHVPERKIEVYYVVGEVGRAGAFELPVKQKVLVSQALAQAGGPGKTAKMSDGILVRYEGNGNRQELSVDFEAILKGKKPDFQVGANDIIFVPGSTAKTIGYGLLGIIPGTIQGALIWGRY